MHERREYFELHEANALIPQLEYYFGELARIQREVNRLAKEADNYGITLSLDEINAIGGNAAICSSHIASIDAAAARTAASHSTSPRRHASNASQAIFRQELKPAK